MRWGAVLGDSRGSCGRLGDCVHYFWACEVLRDFIKKNLSPKGACVIPLRRFVLGRAIIRYAGCRTTQQEEKNTPRKIRAYFIFNSNFRRTGRRNPRSCRNCRIRRSCRSHYRSRCRSHSFRRNCCLWYHPSHLLLRTGPSPPQSG